MAAQSRLALRSSGRSSHGLDELPATVIQRNPSPANPKKRTQPPSTNHDNGKPLKRIHNDPDSDPKSRNFKVYSRKLGARSIAAPAADQTVTQVAARPRNSPAQPTPTVQQLPYDPTTHNPPVNSIRSGPAVESQSPPKVNRVDKRSLRSHAGGSRFKSELALYFADYDEILSDEPKKQGMGMLFATELNVIDPVPEFLTPETRIYIADEPSTPSISATLPPIALEHGASSKYQPSLDHENVINGSVLLHSRHEGDSFHLNNAERLDFSSAERHCRHITDDPLTDQLYFKAHHRAERREKQHRNREKESAQHEQSQLERILEGLKGQAWLKTMGISGITDSERKSYEAKRVIFIQRVTALLDKFRAWKEEEKRRKAERERSCTVDEDDEDDEEADESDSLAGLDGVDERDSSTGRKHATSRAKRYKQRKSAAARTEPSTTAKMARSKHVNLLPPPVEKPFTSFYSKPYQREAALSSHRRGRVRFAFGQQIPELEQRDYDLPAGMLTRNVLAANARSRRAARRDHKDD
ncbi:MAG: hypothetical protein Q9166_003862 [cf. Caloplaca sp. 2 TL-2023]